MLLAAPPPAATSAKAGGSTEPRSPGRPLEGVKVLDFCWMIAGPLTTQTLGLLGATVVRVETGTRLDTMRASTPFRGKPSRDRSGGFASYNANKLGITLDLNRPDSRQVVERLVRWADVVCENFTPGRMEAWNLGYEDLRALNPDVVMLRSSTWGQDGPYREIPANGIILAGFAGYAHLLGWPDRRPLSPGEPYTDLVSPWFNTSAIISALLRRQRGGGGCLLDVSQLDSALNFIAPELMRASTGEVVARRGPLTLDPFPAGVFQTAGDDTWCAVTVESREQWAGLCGLVPGLAGCEALEPSGLRSLEALIFTSIAALCRQRPADDLAAELQAAGVPAAAVAPAQALFADPQLVDRGHFVELEHPAMGSHAYERSSFRFADRPFAPSRSPLFGEHNGDVLGGILGFSADEIADLYAAGVLN
jgi:benzylsuccinate CoA-transferase BbsF subunit